MTADAVVCVCCVCNHFQRVLYVGDSLNDILALLEVSDARLHLLRSESGC
jgi:phosphoglycolate phosphatase-like HAD superfamily hydrolase